MTEVEAVKAIRSLLDELGVTAGDTIYFAIDMARVPLPQWPVSLERNAIRSRENRWCSFLFEQIMDVLGSSGTLLIGTFSYSCGNPEIPFVYEETPSEIGPFTNWIRKHPHAIRSLHPIFSVAGIGPKAATILNNTGRAAFGPCSPFGRLTSHDTRFVNLGVPLRLTLTYIHHLEQCYGCNHRYHKTFSGDVIKNGQKLDGEFLGYMRWRGVDASVHLLPLEEALRNAGVLREASRSSASGQSVLAADLDRIAYKMLSEDSRAFSSPKIRVLLDESMVSDTPGQGTSITFKLSP